jgi:hypothetical protein
MSDEQEAPTAAKTPNRAVRSLAFLAIVGVVLGVFFYLSSLDAPPNLPADAVHGFRFDAKQRLVGLKTDPPDTAPKGPDDENLKYNLKAVEKRINAQCAACHGKPPEPGMTLDTTVCTANNVPCMPATHPPKDSCIKCHRTGG